MIKVYAGLAVAAVVAVLGGTGWYVWQQRNADPFADCRQSAVAGGAAALGGPFTLVDQQGRTVSDKDVITGPSLLYFGYTFCPDVCPEDVARNVEAIDALEEMGHEVTPIFITVDPKRDTPEVMREYAEIMHPRMIALTGSDAQIKAAAQAYRTFYNAHDTGDEFYTVDHMTFSYLVDPKYGTIEVFRRELTGEQLAGQIACFVEKR